MTNGRGGGKSVGSLRWVLPFLLVLGAALRLGLFLAHRCLWTDEAWLALNILHRGPSELLRPLEFDQVAPPGFLLLVKGAQEVFGSSELALRLVPLLLGLASLPLFFSLARRSLRPGAVPVACLLFAIAEPLVLYATEVKPYSGDVAVALMLWWFASRVERFAPGPGFFLIFGLAGAAAILFSYPAVFVLGGIGLGILLGAEAGKRSRVLAGLALSACFWGAGAVAVHSMLLHDALQKARLTQYFTESVQGFPPGGLLAGARWVLGRAFRLVEFPGGLDHGGLPILCVLVGAVTLARRDRRAVAAWMGAFALALLAASAGVYPFEGRLVLFLVPAVYLLAAEGVQQIRSLLRCAPAGGSLVSGALVVLLLWHPVAGSFDGIKRPRHYEQLAPVLHHVSASRRPGDAVYMYYGAQYAARYYLETRRFTLVDLPVSDLLASSTEAVGSGWYAPALVSRPPTFFVGSPSRGDWLGYGRQLDALAGLPRIWVIFSHVNPVFLGVDERRLFLEHLDAAGTRLEAFEQPGASAFLYDLRPRR